MRQPEIVVFVSSYQRPEHLRRALLSLALQRDVGEAMEVVVTDDGSPGTSLPVVEAFARQVDFSVRFTTHPHNEFRLARCRNEGVAVSEAPYLLFTDGDCLLPPDHVKWHLEYRRAGRVVVGDCYRLDRETSDRITEGAICSGEYLTWIPSRERRRMAGKAFRGWWYHRFGGRMHPRMTGNNIGIWRTDFERVNGFDENYVGWGLEDRDLQLRLGRLGLEFKSILSRTAGCHLWHEPAPSFARNNLETRNLDYFQRKQVSTRCQNGLIERMETTQTIRLDRHVCLAGLVDPADDVDAGQDEVADTIPLFRPAVGTRFRKAA